MEVRLDLIGEVWIRFGSERIARLCSGSRVRTRSRDGDRCGADTSLASLCLVTAYCLFDDNVFSGDVIPLNRLTYDSSGSAAKSALYDTSCIRCASLTIILIAYCPLWTASTVFSKSSDAR